MTTEEKIEQLMTEYFNNVFTGIDRKIIFTELETLVLIAKLEMLNKGKKD